jgi:signal transduction histidine kinase
LGCNAACISGLGAYLPAFFGFYFSSLIPLAYVIFERQEPGGNYLTVLALLYLLTLTFNVRGYNRNVIAAFKLQAENEILAADLIRADAEKAALTRSKWDMLAHLSHELRTPMNAIIGFSGLMREQLFGPIGERYLSYCGHIDKSGRHAVGLIDAILDVSQAAAGRAALIETEIPPSALIEECLRMVENSAAAKRVTLDTRLGQSLPRVAGDRDKLRQALLNLLTNAIKYTPEGGSVCVKTLIDGDGLDIAVIDTGVGIAANDLQRCLEPFVRLGNPLTAGVEGVGLGLPLAKHMVELHGGSLHISSEPGRGTVVTLHVPVERCLAA